MDLSERCLFSVVCTVFADKAPEAKKVLEFFRRDNLKTIDLMLGS